MKNVSFLRQSELLSVGEKAISVLNNIQPDLDVTIANIEKKSKEVTKSGGIDGKARQKLLRELLAEM